jgi:hypothetical protein
MQQLRQVVESSGREWMVSTETLLVNRQRAVHQSFRLHQPVRVLEQQS